MTIDIDTPKSPGWWLQRLNKKLLDRNKEQQHLFDRYEGNTPMPAALRTAPDSAKRFYNTARTSFAEMIVKSVKYPLNIGGVLTAEENGDLGDSVAWKLLTNSGMFDESDDVHRLAILSGNGYGVVQYHEGTDSYRYTCEDPRQIITQHDPIVQSEVIAAARWYYDAIEERACATLWLEGKTHHAFKPQKSERGYNRFSAGAWEWDPEFGGEEGAERDLPPIPGLPKIPVFRYRNEEGVSEIGRHVGVLDRIDHLVLQGMTIATYQAFKQRAIKVPAKDMPRTNPKTGDVIDYDKMFSADPGALWRLPETAELWESGQVDLTPVWLGVDKGIQQLSAVTFTPLAMFSPEGQNQSAEGASFAREGRTFKIEDRQRRFGHTHVKALSLLFAMSGFPERANPDTIEIVWSPAERHSLTQKTQALINTGSMPWQARMEEVMQLSPRKIERMKRMREEDALRDAMIAGMMEAAAAGPDVPEGDPDARDDNDDADTDDVDSVTTG